MQVGEVVLLNQEITVELVRVELEELVVQAVAEILVQVDHKEQEQMVQLTLVEVLEQEIIQDLRIVVVQEDQE